MSEVLVSGKLPILALRGLAVFPDQTVHFDVGRAKSIKALESAMKADQNILLIPQRDMMVDDPALSDLYTIGTVAKVKQVLKAHGDNLRVLVTGLCRARIADLEQTEPYLYGQVCAVPETEIVDSPRNTALRREATMLFGLYLDAADHNAQSVQMRLMSTNNTGFVADTIAQNSGIEFPEKCKLLSQLNPSKRLENVVRLLRHEVEVLKLEALIQERTKASMDQNQKDYYLREQMKAIREELGEGDDLDECATYAAKIKDLKLAEEIEKKLLKDVERLKKQAFGSSEASVLRNYLDTLLELPWNVTTKERVDVSAASKILEADHFGMEKVKQRILETIAVRQMAPGMPPQILCLVGPPGVGKTSISYSIAKSLNRKMARIALGGVHDEAEIRGHRKTYVGAMPGRIMQAITQAGSCNPILLLDEIDKLGRDHRGDPSAALLEVLDGEQNATYRDHYLEIPFDLSDVMFITTANTLDTVPRPLLDRMEIIELSSYTDEEKLMIAKNHLIPKQLKKHGLKKSQLRITDDAVREIISGYTHESGVRNLERSFAEILRKAAMELLAQETPKRITVTEKNLVQYLGVRKIIRDRLHSRDEVGLVTGLAWTSVGGETMDVEVNVMEGSGKLELTGNLGLVMKESVQAALTYIRSHAKQLGIAPDFHKTTDIHVHFPSAAVPKDGPSAGITVCTALVSALTGRTVCREVAMTGEVSIRGRVLPIGGLKEKTMGALRHGIKTVIIPVDNASDLEEIDQSVRAKLNFVIAEHMDIVLEAALNLPQETAAPVLTHIPEEMAKQPVAGIRQ